MIGQGIIVLRILLRSQFDIEIVKLTLAEKFRMLDLVYLLQFIEIFGKVGTCSDFEISSP